jgi:hypothetical protein
VAAFEAEAAGFGTITRRVLRREVRDRLLFIDVGDRLAAARAGKALRKGSVLCWGGDVMIGYSSGGRGVLLEYLGLPTSVSPFTYNLARTLRPSFVLGVARASEAAAPAIDLRFERMDVAVDSPASHVQSVYGAIEREVVDNYGQWSLWRAFGVGALGGLGGPARSSGKAGRR